MSAASNGGLAVNGYVVTPYVGATAQTAQTFNSTRNTFPTNIIAGAFGSRFAEKAYFKAQSGAETAPRVQF